MPDKPENTKSTHPYSDIFDERTILTGLLVRALEDEGAKMDRRILLSTFIEKAATNPHDIEPEIIFFVGKMLKKLVIADFIDPIKTLGLPSKHDDTKTSTLLRDFQLAADVNYLIENKLAIGGEGACKLLSKESPHYNHTNVNSLQSTYRSGINRLCEWWQIERDNILDLNKCDTAAQKGKHITENSIFHKKRDPLI